MRYILLLIFFLVELSALAAPAPLNSGRYVGFVRVDGASSALAAVADVYLYQPEDLNTFPRQQISLRIGFGGLLSSEYVTMTYTDVRYDFDNGNITLDEAGRDFVVNATVEQRSKPTIVGTVWITSAVKSGTIELTLLDDEPVDEDPSAPPPPTFSRALSGEYVGQCGMQRSVMIIDEARADVDDSAPPSTNTLKDYSIYARLGYDDPDLCRIPGRPANMPHWCSVRPFDSATFNFYTGKLILTSSFGVSPCELVDDHLHCTVRMLNRTDDCNFVRTATAPVVSPAYSARLYNLRPSSAQASVLPQPSPPENADLVSALRGTFSGYLHHELTNKYQPTRLRVSPSISTNNPHNPNMTFVSTQLILNFGPDLNGGTLIQDFARKACPFAFDLTHPLASI